MDRSSSSSQPVPITDLDERYRRLRLPVSDAEASAMRSSLERFGQLSPIAVCPRGEALAILDGFKRVSAARLLGLPTVEVREMPLSEEAAIAAIYGLNRATRGLTTIEEALIVEKLCREHGLSQIEVARLMSKHPSWVSRRLMLIERLSEEVQDDLRVGLVSSTVARQLIRLPRGNQGEVVASIHRHGLTSREAERLVNRFERTTSRDGQQALLETPRALLDLERLARPSSSLDPALEPEIMRFKHLLFRVAEISTRLLREADLQTPITWTEHEREAMTSALAQTHTGARALGTKLGELLQILEAVDVAHA